MNLSKLPKTTVKKKKRIGRGYGSGKGGHTVGRGAKGQKVRGKVKIYFEGGQLPLMRRLPMQRGKGKFKSFRKKPLIVNIQYLNFLPENTVVDLKNLIKYKIVDEKEANLYGVKILGEGELKKPLIVKLPVSIPAKKKIEKAGGKTEI